MNLIVLGIIRDSFAFFALESILIILLNIYITFCPWDIEGTFSTLYFTLKSLSHEFGILSATFIINLFDINIERNFTGIEKLIYFNVLMLFIGLILIFLLKMPSIEELNSKNIFDIGTAREFFNDETLSIWSFNSNAEYTRRYLSLR